jgi:hypothetical protein
LVTRISWICGISRISRIRRICRLIRRLIRRVCRLIRVSISSRLRIDVIRILSGYNNSSYFSFLFLWNIEPINFYFFN